MGLYFPARMFATAALAGAACAAAAQGPEVIRPGQEKFSITLGVFLPAWDTKLRVDNDSLGEGTDTDLANDLGVERNNSGALIGAEWRFAPRHRIGFTYSRFTFDATRTIDRNLQIGDEIYPAGASVSTYLKIEVIPIAYSYSLLKRDNDELGVTGGLHWSRITFRVQGSVSLGNQDASAEASAKGSLPLPLLGLRYDHHFSDRWSAGADTGVFAISYGEGESRFKGRLWSARVYGEYRLLRNVAAGAAIEGFGVRVDASDGEWDGTVRYGYWGPQLYLKARF